ncbi:GAF and ANTAR domain-containing protein [Promicromonospora vindobonensis]|uniref:GAF and ANTAR domain-containing protein n=1 Tax=Promicromonospora vindobonensis TaxID=195748 RepID=A0ABW5VUM0_9MICO
MDSAEILALLARGRSTGQEARPLAARLCDACAEILGAEAGMLTLTSAAERLTVRTAEFAGSAVAQVEDLQVVLGEGPAELAFAEGRTVVVHLDGHDADAAAFPMFATMAAAIDGPLSVYAVPMRPSGRVVGILTLYLSGGQLARPIEEAEFLADAAGAALLGDPDTADIGSQPAWPQQALVHQATGVVVAQLGIAPTDALAVLRAHAFARASTLESVVDDVLASRLVFSSDGAENDNDGIVSEQHPRTEEP